MANDIGRTDELAEFRRNLSLAIFKTDQKRATPSQTLTQARSLGFGLAPHRTRYGTDNRFDPMDRLRDEILQAQKIRSDLLKWKLGLVGGIGAAGLGFAGSVELQHADLVLCALPPVAVYVDLLALHLTLRMLVIGAYFRTSRAAEAGPYRGYEEFVRETRDRGGGGGAFRLEDWALSYSTYALCAAVAGYGVYQLVDGSAYGIPFVLSGAVGAVASFLGGRQYASRRLYVDGLEPKPTGHGDDA
jgi:hypothetical protein